MVYIIGQNSTSIQDFRNVEAPNHPLPLVLRIPKKPSMNAMVTIMEHSENLQFLWNFKFFIKMIKKINLLLILKVFKFNFKIFGVFLLKR